MAKLVRGQLDACAVCLMQARFIEERCGVARTKEPIHFTHLGDSPRVQPDVSASPELILSMQTQRLPKFHSPLIVNEGPVEFPKLFNEAGRSRPSCRCLRVVVRLPSCLTCWPANLDQPPHRLLHSVMHGRHDPLLRCPLTLGCIPAQEHLRFSGIISLPLNAIDRKPKDFGN